MQWMNLSERFTEISGNGLMADYIPILVHFPTKGVREMRRWTDEYLGKIEKEIKEHQVKYDGGKADVLS